MGKKLKKISKPKKKTDIYVVLFEYFVRKGSATEISKMYNFYDKIFPESNVAFMMKKFFINYKDHKKDEKFDFKQNEQFILRLLTSLKKKQCN